MKQGKTSIIDFNFFLINQLQNTYFISVFVATKKLHIYIKCMYIYMRVYISVCVYTYICLATLQMTCIHMSNIY